MRAAEALGRPVVAEVDKVSRRFGRRQALNELTLRLDAGEIHALLGPNGAGKTTLVRILAGLTTPTSGRVLVLGRDATSSTRALRQSIGLVPSGDRSFYLRISGLENLVFFGRLQGLRRRAASARALELLEAVGLAEAARVRVGEYSHGMQKRLSVARALFTRPAVLLVDEATHDLDPDGARTVRELVEGVARDGAGVLWATQRIEEIRGFADRVTLLRAGESCFQGSVPELLALAAPRRYLLQVANGSKRASQPESLTELLAPLGTVTRAAGGSAGHYLLALEDDVLLGDALARLAAARVPILSCAEERSGIEQAFLSLTGGGAS